MKKVILFLIIDALCLIVGCHKEYPNPVELIAPADGVIFDIIPPEFMWHSDPVASDYIIRIVDETGSGIFDDSLKDTAYTIPDTIFSQIADGIYKWMVAPLPSEDEPLWSDCRTFIFDKEGYQTPMLISPEDGDTFNITPPEFVWHSRIGADSYVIRIVKDAFFTGEVIAEDTLEDTIYTLFQGDFEIALNADYVWSVAPLYPQVGLTWREFRTLILNKPLPSEPKLVSPAEGTEFTDSPPSFVWHSEALAKAYILLLHGENLPYGDTIVVDTLEDTTYALSRDVFEGLYNGTYKWSVASVAKTNESFWSMERSLNFNQPVPLLDLDTTYFPFGLGYEWVYEEDGWSDEYGGNVSWLDTFTVRSVDSTSISNGWIFNFEAIWEYSLNYIPAVFFDVGNPARVIGKSIVISGDRNIPLSPAPANTWRKEGGWTITFKIEYQGDALSLVSDREYTWKPEPDISYSTIGWSSTRVKGIGVIYQSYWDMDIGGGGGHGTTSNLYLLYFIQNGDTVWRCEECP